MSGDYVSKAAAINKIMENIVHQDSHDVNLHNIGLRKAMSAIDSLPAADVRPVIHAHWYVDGGCAYCSNCRNNFKKAILKEAKYCPKCGAQIDGYGGHPDAGPPTPYDLLYEEGWPDA